MLLDKLTHLPLPASRTLDPRQFLIAKDGRVHGRYGPAVPPSVLVSLCTQSL